MSRTKKLSMAKASGKSLSVKSRPLAKATVKKLSVASKKASENIDHNNQVYASSNSHASYYATK